MSQLCIYMVIPDSKSSSFLSRDARNARGHETKRVFLPDRQPYVVECQSLCGSEVSGKNTQSEVEGARAPVPHGDANDAKLSVCPSVTLMYRGHI